MKNILIVVSTKNGVNNQTRQCIEALREKGAQYIEQQGCSDVALARNIALTLAYNQIVSYKELEVILMIDDDMLFETKDAKRVCESAISLGAPTSGACVRADGKFFAKPMNKARWVCGLAFLAIPRNAFLELADRSKKIILDSGECIVFTWAGADEREWVGEDHRLSRRMGGVQVLPIRIGHLKQIPLYPADENQETEFQAWLTKQLDSYK